MTSEYELAVIGQQPDESMISAAYSYELSNFGILWNGLYYSDLAHVIMLFEGGLIPEEDGKILLRELLRHDDFNSVRDRVSAETGDIFSNKSQFLRDAIGEPAGWYRLGRPRREAINIAFLLCLKREMLNLKESMNSCLTSLIELSGKHDQTIMPDYTYLQQAHPTTFGHYVLTYAFPLIRDLERLAGAYLRLDASPGGSGAVNGSSLPLDRERLAHLLGFESVSMHTRDAMWQPDIPLESVAILSSIFMNLKRFAEELQIFSSHEFSFVEIPGSLSRSSHIMPQKKNPYSLTYIRGMFSFILGKVSSYAALGGAFSGNPDSRIFIYDDLPILLSKGSTALAMFSQVIRRLTAKPENMRSRMRDQLVCTVDLAETISTTYHINYQLVHSAVGRFIRDSLAAQDNAPLALDRLREHLVESSGKPIDLTTEQIGKLLEPSHIIDKLEGIGGACAERTQDMILHCKNHLEQSQREHKSLKDNWTKALSRLTDLAKDISS